MREQLGQDLPLAIGGPLGTGYQALTLKWLHDNRARMSSETARVASPVDAVGYLLTGRLATDPSNAVGTGLFDASAMTWRPDLIEKMSARPKWLPDLIGTGSPIGPLTDQGAALLDLEPGLPVFHCGGDCASSAVGGQVLGDTSAMITLSTGAQVIRPVPIYAPEPEGRWHTWPAAIPSGCDADRWISVGALLNAGRALSWIHRTLAPGSPIAEVIALADVSEPGSGGVLFLPYLVGERTPLADPHVRGAFLGLSDSHEAHHLVRAVIEGIALSIADVLDQMTGSGGAPRQVVFGGGGSSSQVRQILASVTGLPLTVPAIPDVAALGAARIAAHTLGWASIDASTEASQAPTVVNPVRAHGELYRERLAVFRDAGDRMSDVSHRLHGDPG
jgi:xylulokinase